MITITLTPELESAIAERAKQMGVAPEVLVLAGLREQYLSGSREPAPMEKNVVADARSDGADFLLSMAGMFESGIHDTSDDTRTVIMAAIDHKHRK